MRRPRISTTLAGVDTGTLAVVPKFDPNVMHHGGLGVIRGLGRLGVPVYGVHRGCWAPAASSRYLSGRWYWRPCQEDAERVRAGQLQLARRIGRPAVLIPTDDAGAIFLADQGDGLRPWFLFPEPSRDLPRRLACKHCLPARHDALRYRPGRNNRHAAARRGPLAAGPAVRQEVPPPIKGPGQ